MIVAHLGPPLGRTGGPAGYVAQVQRAFERHASGQHRVLFPPTAPPAQYAGPRSNPILSWLRRCRLTWGTAPRQRRPGEADLQRVGGHLDHMFADVWSQMARDAEVSIDRALSTRADVLFAHNPAVAEAALTRRSPGQQVWLFLHAPMPHAVYLAWSWAVPERAWEEVRLFPDVQAWMARELRVLAAVDRIWLPCPEAGEEWVRVHARFATPLARASYLLTGAEGPPRDPARPVENRRRWRLPAGVPVVLFLGSDEPYRGLDVLLDALDLLPPWRDAPGVVAVAGVRPDSLPWHRRLAALGRVSDVGALLAAVDALINVNRLSLFDLSTIEALEAGRPLLLSPVGGNRTFRDLGAGCVMLDGLDPAAIARGLATCFQMTGSAKDELGRRSRACYDAHLTLRHLRDRHLAAYDAAHALAALA